MKNQRNDISGLKIRDIAKNIINKAKQKDLVKPLSDAFKDIPASKEVHQGEKNYYINQ